MTRKVKENQNKLSSEDVKETKKSNKNKKTQVESNFDEKFDENTHDIAVNCLEHENGKKSKDKKKSKKEKAIEQDEEVKNGSSELNGNNSDDEVLKKKDKKKHKKKLHENVESNGNHSDEEVSKKKAKRKRHEENEVLGGKNDDEEKLEVPSKKHKVSNNAEQIPEKAITLTGPGSENYPPITSFSSAGFPPQILNLCRQFQKPTPIQSQSWPVLLDGKDLIGIAETGSGKTLGFAIPGLLKIKNYPQKRKIQMLILAPTRELALQNLKVLEEFGSPLGISSLCVYGGVGKTPQIQALKTQSINALVATPGRLKDLMEMRCCDLSHVSYLILDEADRMLDQGFEKDVVFIVNSTSSNRQTALFSATWPTSVQELASSLLRNPLMLTIGDTTLTANNRVQQIIEVIDEDRRKNRLLQLLRMYYNPKEKNRIIIFVLYKNEADRIEEFVNYGGFKCVSIHGNKSQAQRESAVESFRNQEISLLVATDVASRGLDIPDVQYVINFSFPLTIEDYIHRIGRTGRAGKTGIAHTFFHHGNKPLSGELILVLNQSNMPVPEELRAFGTHIKKKEHALYGAFTKQINTSKTASRITFDSDEDN